MKTALQFYKINAPGKTVPLERVASVSMKEALGQNYTTFGLCNSRDWTFLAAYSSFSPELDFFELTAAAPWLQRAGSYFVAYKTDGATVLYRIHCDCQDWTAVGSANLPAGASSILMAPLADAQLCVVV